MTTATHPRTPVDSGSASSANPIRQLECYWTIFFSALAQSPQGHKQMRSTSSWASAQSGRAAVRTDVPVGWLCDTHPTARLTRFRTASTCSRFRSLHRWRLRGHQGEEQPSCAAGIRFWMLEFFSLAPLLSPARYSSRVGLFDLPSRVARPANKVQPSATKRARDGGPAKGALPWRRWKR